MNRKYPRPFKTHFNPLIQPGFQTRYNSGLSRFYGGAQIKENPLVKTRDNPEVNEDLRAKWKSGQVPQLLPSSMNFIKKK